jgi:DivIVA domain-containing protein
MMMKTRRLVGLPSRGLIERRLDPPADASIARCSRSVGVSSAGGTTRAEIRHTRGVVGGDEVRNGGERETNAPPESEEEHRFRDLSQYVPRDLLDVSFPVSVRGYDRAAVDAYVKRVNRVIAELKVSASPPAAVRHAVDQAGAKVEGLLEAARKAAEEITASARQEAEETSARAKAEAADLIVNTSADADRLRAEANEISRSAGAEAEATVATAKAEASETLAKATAEAEATISRAQDEANEHLRRSQAEIETQRLEAETRMGQIQADTETIWTERRQLHDDIRAMASSLVDLVNAAAARLPLPERTQTNPETPKPATADETEQALAPDEPAPAAHPSPGSGRRDQNRENVPTATTSAPDT